jgi:hypothetical protein
MLLVVADGPSPAIEQHLLARYLRRAAVPDGRKYRIFL